jgi:hypothetical protein
MTLIVAEHIALGNEIPPLTAVTYGKREKAVRGLIKRYESAIFGFFRELSLPLKFREIVRAYILASDGNTVFEASYNELTDLLFKRSATRLQANRETVIYHAKALQDWQAKKEIELIRVVKKGRKINHPDGSTEYLKTRYELVLLDELVKVLYNCPANEINKRIKETVNKMKQAYQADDVKREIPVKYMLERNTRTLFTKFDRTFEQAEAINLNPVRYCQRLITELQAKLDRVVADRAENQRRESYISAFCAPATLTDAMSYEDKGVERYHVELQGNTVGNIPSVNCPLDDYPVSCQSDVQPEIGALSDSQSLARNDLFLNPKIETPDNENPLLQAALRYAQAGFPVFPLHNPIFADGSVRCSCREGQRCEKIGKHPRTWHGLKDATTDAETIKLWWQKYPAANVGLLTGKQAGIFVLDVDVKSGGFYSLEELQDSYGELPATLTAVTGSNGKHLIFNYPDVRLSNSTSLIASGLDIKSDNGYVVAAPSVHQSGGHYQWHGVNTEIADAPAWLIAVILLAEEDAKQNKQVKSVNISDHVSTLTTTEKIKEGQEFDTGGGKSRGRHDYLFRYAAGLVMSHSHEQVLARVQAKNLAVCVPPLTNADVVKAVASAERYRPQQFPQAA